MAKDLKYFKIEKKRGFIEIICLFEEANEDILQEIKSVFNLVFFGSNENIKLNTIKVAYFDHTLINEILNFAKGLKEKKRKFFIYEITNSFQRYLNRFNLDQLVPISPA
ncbi:MAG: hypothetical protein L6Q54_06885 [Leptospiraceae bacterium]|nr:hypothetical protein [Leptospiraceae bacterium]MCK6380963.1 hypothetical protein [Leptospiraceae bacterium]NUM40942.1 hypothetical protein [Leptospiraceae bacterium]